jgi:hypothetical protein
VAIVQDVIEQSGLASPEEAGQHGDGEFAHRDQTVVGGTGDGGKPCGASAPSFCYVITLHIKKTICQGGTAVEAVAKEDADA